MSATKSASIFAVVMFSAATLLAGLSREVVQWRKGPAKFLMTSEEMQKWDSLKSDADAQAFIDLFWARRDPTPATPLNEFRRTYEVRVAWADSHYAYGDDRGAVTDRGKITVLLGVPSSIVQSGKAVGANIPAMPGSAAARGSSTPTEPSSAPSSGSRGSSGGLLEASNASNQSGREPRSETWIYELRKDNLNKVPEWAPQHNLTIPFVDHMSTGDFELGRWPDTNVEELMKLAVKAAIVNPDLTVAPNYSTATGATNATFVAGGPMASAALIAALDAFKAQPESPYHDAYLTYGNFITPTGTYYVPVQFYLPKPGTLTATNKVTFFGSVEDEAGKVVRTYEMPAALVASRSALFADESLDLPAGKYKACLGLAAPDGKPLVISRADLDLKPLSKDDAGISPLYLSDNIYALTAAQEETAPFAFGGVKLVVKGDRTFSRQDELWLFFELRNPAVDASGAPKLQMKMDLEGTVGTEIVRMAQASRDTTAEPLKGVPGHYVVGRSIPLAGFKPGQYAIRVEVTDTAKPATYSLQESFRITE